MALELANLLRATITRELPFLRRMDDATAARHPNGTESWSPKQELGHLIDSAANNHVRFVNATLQPDYQGPGYAQNGWVELHGYQDRPWADTVGFWQAYNSFLADLIARIPEAELDTICAIGSYEPASLGFVIEDYVLHMQHHIDHLLQRAAITQYPSAAGVSAINKPA